jgi:hypothetical protein
MVYKWSYWQSFAYSIHAVKPLPLNEVSDIKYSETKVKHLRNLHRGFVVWKPQIQFQFWSMIAMSRLTSLSKYCVPHNTVFFAIDNLFPLPYQLFFVRLRNGDTLVRLCAVWCLCIRCKGSISIEVALLISISVIPLGGRKMLFTLYYYFIFFLVLFIFEKQCLNLESNVTWRLKAGVVKWDKTAVARQRRVETLFCGNEYAGINQRVTQRLTHVFMATANNKGINCCTWCSFSGPH